VQKLLRWLRLPSLRFPGGTVGNFYNWTTDKFYTQDVGCTAIETRDSNFEFGFAGYAEAMAATNASSVLLFDVIYDRVEDSVARLKARVPVLPRIDWIELGNENYAIGQSCGQINPKGSSPPHGADYVAFTTKVAAGLRASGVATIPPLAAPLVFWSAGWSAGGWNRALTSARTDAGAPLYDGFVMHPYVGVKDEIFSAVTAGKMLEASGKMRSVLLEYANNTLEQHRPLLLTEFGILGTATGTFVQALGEASMLMGILDLALNKRSVNIVQAGIHILLAGSLTTPSALFAYDPESNATVATPTGVIWRKFVQVLAGSTLLGSEAGVAALPSGAPGVDVQAVEGAGGEVSLLVVNKLGVDAALRTSNSLGTAETRAELKACGLEVFTQPALSWESWPLEQVDAQFLDKPPAMSVPAMAVAVVKLCGGKERL
jgi:hypothetical protein